MKLYNPIFMSVLSSILVIISAVALVVVIDAEFPRTAMLISSAFVYLVSTVVAMTWVRMWAFQAIGVAYGRENERIGIMLIFAWVVAVVVMLITAKLAGL